MQPREGIRERIGELIGATWAPLVHGIARLRHARMFHPEGSLYRGRLEPVAGPFEAIANALGRTVLARFSGALRRGGRESLDVLGIALRLHHGPLTSTEASDGDQDLLFATILSPFTMPLSPFTTRSHDFFANRFYAVSPFALEDGKRVKFRLSPMEHPPHDGSRAEQLAAAVAGGHARFELAARETLTLRWHPVATITLQAPCELDQAALRFDPFHAGAGIEPVGVVHAIRRRAYPASQGART